MPTAKIEMYKMYNKWKQKCKSVANCSHNIRFQKKPTRYFEFGKMWKIVQIKFLPNYQPIYMRLSTAHYRFFFFKSKTLFQKLVKFQCSLPYLDSAWKMHWNEYKQA